MGNLNTIENKIVTKLVQIALGRGLSVSVDDEEDHALDMTTDLNEVMDAVGATDITHLCLHNADGKQVGWIMLVHGNDEDVVSDYLDNELTREIVEEEERSRGQG